MDKKQMSEKLCVLSNHEIVLRRKPVGRALAWLILGVLLLGTNALLQGDGVANWKAALVLAGGATLLYGAAVLLVRLFGGEGIPYYPLSRRYVRYTELYFPKEQMREVVRLCEQCDLKGLRKLDPASVPAVVVAIYETPDGEISACQPYEYVDLEYRPLGEMKLVRL